MDINKNNVWDLIITEFGFKAPTLIEKRGFAGLIIPLETDVLVIEEKSADTFKLPEGLSIHNMFDKERKKDYEVLEKEWDTYYKDVLQEGVKRLNFTASNVNKEKKRVHKLLVLNNIDEVSKSYYTTNFGGLIYNSGIKENSKGNVKIDFGFNSLDKQSKSGIKLFAYGLQEPTLHIVTKEQMDFILSYIPTLQGLVDYLSWKEHLLSSISVISVDEYTLLLIYLLEIFKNNKQDSIFVPFEDKDVVEFVNSDLSKNLLHLSAVYQEFLSYVKETPDFLKHYMLFNFKTLLKFTEQLPDLVYTDYKKHSSKTFMLYQGHNLYIFHNVDKRILEDKKRTVYGGHFISKVAIQYLDELKSDIVIDNIICCVMHRGNNDKLYNTFIALDLKDLENKKSYNDVKNFALEGEALGWLPKSISLEQLVEHKKKEVRATIPTQKGSERNKPCPCGSGLKYKKCCGKFK